MPNEEKKGITVKIDAELHAQVRAYIESKGLTMAEFVSQALDHELHPMQQIGGNTMENMRTLAFQVPESLFQQIKEYLQRNHMTQKQFVIGLIQSEISRDMEQLQAAETAQDLSEDSGNQDEPEDSDESEDESETEDEYEDSDETEDESETGGESEESNESEDESETEDETEESDESEDESDTAEESEDSDETEDESVAEDESMDIWM